MWNWGLSPIPHFKNCLTKSIFGQKNVQKNNCNKQFVMQGFFIPL